MATEYKITYTYTGQGNTGGSRSVALSKFKKSGDTGRTIGQIKSITYEHWHTSTRAYDWALRGRLVLSNGTSFTSNTVTHRISGDTVKYTNTFTNLPTPEQFAQLSKVQTIDPKGSTGDSGYYAKLYWRATSDYKMRVIVTFIEEPPVVYDPKIKEFNVTRCNENGEPDDEGESAIVDLQIDAANADNLKNASLRIYYAANIAPDTDGADYIDLTSRIPEFITGVWNGSDVLPGEWSAGYSWYFAVVFIAGEEFDADAAEMPHKECSLHVAAKHGGICVCGFSNGTAETPMFESYAPGYFYKGINGVTNYELGEVNTGGKWLDGRTIYRSVFKADSTKANADNTIGTIADLGEVVSIYGKHSQFNNTFPLNFFRNDTYYCRAYVSNKGNIVVNSYNSVSCVVIVEYTKSTEEVS